MQEILKFEPIFLEKIWGGNQLKNIFQKEINKTNIGESWELSTYGDQLSVIKNGIWKGKTFKEAIEKYPNILGNLKKEIKKFPLLIKFIDANEFLSVQVHPNQEYAQKQTPPGNSKKESWYIINATNDAKIYCGFNKNTNSKELEELIKKSKAESILNTYKVQKGNSFLLNPGTIHAIGSGIVLLEIQESSDSTYRVYDYGRDRELHLEQAYNVLNYKKTDYDEVLEKKPLSWNFGKRNLLTKNDKFRIEHLESEKETFEIPKMYKESIFQIIIMLEGKIKLDEENTISSGELAFISSEKMQKSFNIKNEEKKAEFILTGLGNEFCDFKED